MKCYYHQDKDAVGTCSRCGKACCRDCIEDIGGALLCKDCIVRERKRLAAEKETAIKEVKWIIRWSWVVTIGVSIFLIPRILLTDPVIRKLVFSVPVIGKMVLPISVMSEEVLPIPFIDEMAFSSTLIDKIALSVLVVYAVWSMFWGWRAIQPLQRARSLLSGWILSFYLFLGFWLLFFSFFIIEAFIYGCLGGGVYQYLKYRKISKGKL